MYSYCYVCSVLYILFSSCELALFGYPDCGFSVSISVMQDGLLSKSPSLDNSKYEGKSQMNA